VQINVGGRAMGSRTLAAAAVLAVAACMTTALGVASAADPTLTLSPDASTRPLVFDATTMAGTMPDCAGLDMVGGTVSGPYVQLMLGPADEHGRFSFPLNVSGGLGDYFQHPSGVLVPPGAYAVNVGCVDGPQLVRQSDSVLYTVPPPTSPPDDTTHPSVSGPLDAAPTSVPAGSSVQIEADGFEWDPLSAAAYSIVLYIDGERPRILQQGNAGDDVGFGHIATQVAIPADTPRGTHTLVLFGNTHKLVEEGSPTGGGAGSAGSFIVENDGLKILTVQIEVTCPMGQVSSALSNVSRQVVRPSAAPASDAVDDLICDVVAPVEKSLLR
jgi:hypothetical protein